MMADAVNSQDGAGPVTVDTVVAGGWLLTMNPHREMYRSGAVAIDGGVIVEVGQRADLLTRYAPRRLIDAPDGVITPGTATCCAARRARCRKAARPSTRCASSSTRPSPP
jgi:adenine deaminase